MDALLEMRLLIGLDATDLTKDAILNVMLSRAERELLAVTHRTRLPDGLVNVQVDMAIIAYNRRGIEGESSHSEGSVSRTMMADLTKNMRDNINSYRLARVGGQYFEEEVSP